jgi:hypothetical protein
MTSHSLPWWYTWSCFSYAICGLIRIWLHEAYLDGILLLIQSFFSYMSDVHTLGNESRWHPIDHVSAVSVTFYHFYSLKTAMSWICNGFIFSIALGFLQQSRLAYSKANDEFLVYHTVWHVLSIFIALTSD